MYPVLSYLFSVSVVATEYLTPVMLAISPLVEPFPLNAIVYVCSVHFAYTVDVFPVWSTVKFVALNTVVSVILFVHPASLYQPSNVYPVLVAVASVPNAPAYVTLLLTGLIDIVLSVAFPLNVTVYLFALVVAVSATTLAGIVNVVSSELALVTVYPVQPANEYPDASTALIVTVAPYLTVYVPVTPVPLAVTLEIPVSLLSVRAYVFLV